MFREKVAVYRINGGGGNRTRVAALAERLWVQDFRRRVFAAHEGLFFGEQTSMYVIWESGGPIKLGVAHDPNDRLKTLQQGNPRRLELVCAFPATLNFERFVHRELRDHRIQGEWFQSTPRVLALVEEFVHITEMCELLNEHRRDDEPWADTDDVIGVFETNVEYDEAERAA